MENQPLSQLFFSLVRVFPSRDFAMNWMIVIVIKFVFCTKIEIRELNITFS